MNSLIDLISNDTSLTLVADLMLKTCGILVIAAIVSACLGRASAASRHLVWTASLVAILMLPVMSTTLPSLEIAILPEKTVNAQQSFPADSPQDGMETVIPDYAQTNNPSSQLAAVETSTGSEMPANPAKPGLTDSDLLTSGAVPFHINTYSALFALWLFGVFIVGLRLAVGHSGIASISRNAEIVTDLYPNQLMNELTDRLEISRHVSLRVTDRKVPPLTWGIVRPVIILPQNEEVWEADRLRVILLHELAHVKRMDWLTQLLGKAACTLHWFNPLAWFAQGRQQIEQEMACDDQVISSGTLPSNYATNLLEILRGIRDHAWPSYASTAMARKSTFEGRVVAILDPTRDRDQLRPLRVASTLAVLAILILPLAALRPVAVSGMDDIPVASNELPDRENTGTLGDDTASDTEAETDTNTDTIDHSKLIDEPVRSVDTRVAINASESIADSIAVAAVDTTKLQAMIVALRDEDAEIRQLAARILGDIGSPDAIPPLGSIVSNDPSAQVRAAAAWALGEIGSDEAVEPLMKALQDQATEVRNNAAWGLGEIESERSVGALETALLNDTSTDVRQKAAWALGEIESPQSIAALTSALKDGDSQVRMYATWALGEIESVDTVPALTIALKDENREVRRNAARALGEIESPSSTSSLIEATDDPDHEVRASVAWALGEIGSDEATPALIRLLEDDNENVRQLAVRALGEIESESSVNPLGKTLSTDASPRVRAAAAQALSEFESPNAVPYLKKALSDSDVNVQRRVARALGEFDDESVVDALLQTLESSDTELRANSARTLGEIRSPDAVPGLVRLLDDESTEVRINAIRALGEIRTNDDSVEQRLFKILESDPNKEIRKAAARALSEM